MSKFCPNCNKHIGHKWYLAYKFCDEYCKQSFIRQEQKKKIPGSHNNSKRKRQMKYRDGRIVKC